MPRRSDIRSSPTEILTRELNRRQFVGACCAAVGATGLLSALAQLRLIAALAQPATRNLAATGTADFKALVCLYMQGGNDANNAIVPTDTAGYAAYLSARSALALPQTSLLPLAPRTTDGRSWGLHPAMSAVHDLFAQGKLAILANVGTLVYPTTKDQYVHRSVPLPPQLFSHNDQTVQWQSSLPDRPFQTGWGGRVADLLNNLNQNTRTSMSISLAGKNAFQVGKAVAQYAVNPNGAINLSGASSNLTTLAGLRTQALNDLLALPGNNLFDTAFAGLNQNAIADSALLSGILKGTPPFTTVFPTSTLGRELRMIAWLIAIHDQLGLQRQIFFANIDGFDLHSGEANAGDTTTGAHASLLSDVSLSLQAFMAALDQLGVGDRVTTFTASDFGRTFNTNGRGTDHGWGNHHFVMGGAVKGGDIYGQMPNLTLNGPDDVGRGRWIPTTSVDEYNATLALWFGVSPTDLPQVLPNIGRFAASDLGFMNAG